MVGERGGRIADANGLSLMLGDSQTASKTFGLGGLSSFANVPKSKFLFFAKFVRANQTGDSDWQREVGLVVKNVDRPRISFDHEVLNQYNRKRVVQTGHSFEALQIKFHDTVNESINRMFVDYYQYYYGDSKINSAGSSIYDVVLPEAFRLGEWGFLPPMVEQDYGYFFSHITIYQMYAGQMVSFDLINPKIQSFNPDDLDYSSGQVSNEIQMTINYESIVYHDQETIPEELASEIGIDTAKYWDVETTGFTSDSNIGLAISPNEITSSITDVAGDVLLRNLKSVVTGQGGQSIREMGIEIASAFDANRGLAIGNVGLKSVRDLVTGNTKKAKQGAQGLLKGILSSKPGKLF